MRRVIFSPLLVLIVGTAWGQTAAPNFSGEWILNLQASRLHSDLAVVRSGVVSIKHKEPEFSFHRMFLVEGERREVSYEITSDGRERSTHREGMTTVSTMRWDANALVLSQQIRDPQRGNATNRVRELLESGRTLRATEDFVSAGPAHRNVWIFERRGP